MAAESIQKKHMVTVNFELAKIGLIQLEMSRYLVLQCDTIIVKYIADILMFEFCAGMS